MRGLRSAFLALIESLPETIRRAADLERSLNLSTTLAWQVHRVATCPNPLEAGGDVPGAAATRQVLKAARAKGVDAARLAKVTQAMEAFDTLVTNHAGDRATFATMIHSLAGCDTEAIDLKARRQAFRLHSHIWGMQVKTILSCGIYHPGARPEVVEVASLRGLREIRRLRIGAPFRLMSQLLTDSRLQSQVAHALDQSGAQAPEVPGPKLLLEHCTKPFPELHNRVEGGRVHTYLQETPLGNAGAQTVFIADISRGVEWATPGDAVNDNINYYAIMKPAEALVLDTLIHRDMFGPLTPNVRVYGSLDRLGEPHPLNFLPDEQVPIRAEVHRLGEGLSVLPTPHLPRYAEMVESVCRGAGWDPDAFDLYRCVVEYPLLSSVVSVRFVLPEQGNW